MNSAFSELSSLRVKSKNMVLIAARIKEKVAAKALNENEMAEI